MDLPSVLWIYLIFVIITFLIAYCYGYHFWESLVISSIIGLIILLAFYPPSELNIDSDNYSCIAIYILILIVTILIVCLYALKKAICSPRCPNRSLGNILPSCPLGKVV